MALLHFHRSLSKPFQERQTGGKEEFSAFHSDRSSKWFGLRLRLIDAWFTIPRGPVVVGNCNWLANHWIDTGPRAYKITVIGPLLLHEAELIRNIGLKTHEEKTHVFRRNFPQSLLFFFVEPLEHLSSVVFKFLRETLAIRNPTPSDTM